jgi:hypothetical protein
MNRYPLTVEKKRCAVLQSFSEKNVVCCMHRLSKLSLFLCSLSFLALSPRVVGASDAEVVLELLNRAEEKTALVHDYTLTLTKQERVDGILHPAEVLFVKWKRPFMIYLKFISGKNRGREIIYVEGGNNNKMIVSPGGVLGALSLKVSPESSIARRGNRHSITEAGMPSTLRRITDEIRHGMKTPGSEMSVVYVGEESFGGDRCIHFIIMRGSYAERTDVYIYEDLLLVRAVMSFDESGRLLESFEYSDVRVNVGLTEEDFNPENKAYDF